MSSQHTHHCHDQTLLLHSERAIYWVDARTLIVADLHFGKEMVFQRSGIAIPSGVTEADISRLACLVKFYRAERLLVLGDLVHALPHRSEPWLDALKQWIDSATSLEIVVVVGNHDKVGVAEVLDRRIDWRPELVEFPFVARHHPGVDDNGYVLSGHLHPVFSMSDDIGDKFRLPMFWFSKGYAVLPAFGTFVGGYNVTPSTIDDCFVVCDGKVLDLKSASTRS